MSRVVVEKWIKDPVGRVTRLIKLTDDEAKDMMKHCIHLSPESGYQTARTTKQRYGKPNSLLASYRKEIKELPSVKPRYALNLRLFQNFVLSARHPLKLLYGMHLKSLRYIIF